MNKRRNRKAGGINETLQLLQLFPQELLTSTLFLLAPAANILRTSRIPIGCMI